MASGRRTGARGRGCGRDSTGSRIVEDVEDSACGVAGDQGGPQPNVDVNGRVPGDPTLVTILQTLTQAIVTISQATQGPVAVSQSVVNDPFESFQNRNPKMFKGVLGTEKPEVWLDNIEKIFGTMSCTSELKVKLATFVLQGEASQWWKAEKRAAKSKGVQAFTWDMFLDAFNKKYFPPSVQEKKVVDFIDLKQGSLTVDEYDAKFTELSNYLPTFFDNEEQKARKFERGLSDTIRYPLTALKLPTYAEVLDRARLVEQESAEYRKKKDEKKRGFEDHMGRYREQSNGQGITSGGYKRRSTGDNHNRGTNQPAQIQNQGESQNQWCNKNRGPNQDTYQVCRLCRGKHLMEACHWDMIACFNCGKAGHRTTNCLKPQHRGFTRNTEGKDEEKPKGQGRTTRDAMATNEVMAGTMKDDRAKAEGDKLVLRGLMFHGFHGVEPEERKLGQKFLIDVDAWMDLRAAGKSDNLLDTISYADIYRIVKEVVEGPFQTLLESVAEKIASNTLKKYSRISAVRVKVGKPHVAVDGPVDYLGVEIIRYRGTDVK